MAHDWDGLVLGGLDKPRLLLCNENWDTNPFFSDGAVGDWVKTGANGTLEVVADDNAYGSNVLHYYDAAVSAAGDYITLEFDTLTITGASNFGKKFIVSLRIKTGELSEVTIQDGAAYSISVDVNPEDDFQKIFLVTESLSSTENVIQIVINTQNQTDDFDIKIDNIFFTEVTQDLIFKQPNDSKLVFEENMIGSNELWTGKVQKFDRKFRPIFLAEWEYIGAGWEYYRQLAYQASLIFCIPHREVNWGFLGIMNGDFERQYSFKRFFGHKGGVEVMGVEYLYELPYNQSGGGGIYIDEEELIIE